MLIYSISVEREHIKVMEKTAEASDQASKIWVTEEVLRKCAQRLEVLPWTQRKGMCVQMQGVIESP